MKLCKDCKHFSKSRGRYFSAECRHPDNLRQEPVYGIFHTKASPEEYRKVSDGCGFTGKKFEQKEKVKFWRAWW